MTYTDMQLGAVTADATGAVAFLTANAGKANITGLEVEVQGAIGAHWVIDATLGTLDFQYKDLGALGKVDLLLVTHGHADHARGGHGRLNCPR